VDNLNIGKSRKVFDIERHDLRNSVGFHRGDKPRIVHLNTSDRMRDHQLPPILNNLHCVRQDCKKPLKAADVPIRAFDAEPQPVYALRACADIPEFREILQGQAQRMALSVKGQQGHTRRVAGGMALLYGAQQNVGIDQNAHLPAVRIQAGAADGFIGERRRLRDASEPFLKLFFPRVR
jgi:hypothetical protein